MEKSPLYLEMALAFYVSVDPVLNYDHARWRSRGALDARMALLRDGMVRESTEDETGNFQKTDKLEFWVRHILSTPLPVQQFTIPDTSRKALEDNDG